MWELPLFGRHLEEIDAKYNQIMSTINLCLYFHCTQKAFGVYLNGIKDGVEQPYLRISLDSYLYICELSCRFLAGQNHNLIN